MTNYLSAYFQNLLCETIFTKNNFSERYSQISIQSKLTEQGKIDFACELTL